MGAQMPDAYRYRGGEFAREYPRPGAGRSASTPTESSTAYRRTDEDNGFSTTQSSPFAPREQQVLPEREYAHYDEPSIGVSQDSSPYGRRRRLEEHVEMSRDDIARPATSARPAPRPVSVEQMYVPAEEVEEAHRRDAMAYPIESAESGTGYRETPRAKRHWKIGLGMFALKFFAGFIATIVAIVALVALGGGETSQFATAVHDCEAAPFAQVSSDGSSMEMTTFGKKQPGMNPYTLGCVLEKLDAPASLKQRMNTIRAIDGTQEQTWGSYRATWTYHPDQGLHVVISRE